MNIYELENKLQALKINGKYIGSKTSGFYTDHYVKFDNNITINKIRARESDLSLFFGVPVQVVVDGSNVILRIENTKRQPCYMVDFQTDITNDAKREMPLAIGVDGNGNKIYYDLVKLPHLLVAGSTGSGKSVFLNDCILSTLFKNNNSLVLIDVKRVEFSIYEPLKCLYYPIAYDIETASNTLHCLCKEMDQRYKMLQQNHARNIKEYTENGGKMKYITIVIDEIADIMLQNKKAVESYIIRLAQLGRAAGIHLIIATQRPSADILTSLIKANIPSRISFSVASAIDSRVILDQKGAETLHGNGDGLFLPIGSNNPVRIQAPFIETRHIIDFVNNGIDWM